MGEGKQPQGPKTCNSNARPSAIDTDRDTVIDIDRWRETDSRREREGVLPGAVTTFTEITQKTAAGGQKFSTEAKGNVFPQIS